MIDNDVSTPKTKDIDFYAIRSKKSGRYLTMILGSDDESTYFRDSVSEDDISKHLNFPHFISNTDYDIVSTLIDGNGIVLFREYLGYDLVDHTNEDLEFVKFTLLKKETH